MALLAVVGEIGCQHRGYCFGWQTGRRTLPLPGLRGGPAGGRDRTVGAGGDEGAATPPTGRIFWFARGTHKQRTEAGRGGAATPPTRGRPGAALASEQAAVVCCTGPAAAAAAAAAGTAAGNNSAAIRSP